MDVLVFGLLPEIEGDPVALKENDAVEISFDDFVVRFERCGSTEGIPVRAKEDLANLPGFGPSRRDPFYAVGPL